MSEKKEEKVKLEFSKLTAWKIISGLLAILLIVSIYTGGFGIDGEEDNDVEPTPSAPQQPSQPQPVIADKVNINSDDPVLGDEDAEVTIIEFSDYQCPFCSRFSLGTMKQIKADYIDTGKVKLVFKDYPLPFHSEADEASIAAACAGKQDKYWEMHDKIFATQQSWSGNANAGDVLAKELKLSTTKFDKCFDDREPESGFAGDMQDGNTAAGKGIGTPSFFIGNEDKGFLLVQGAQPYPKFQAAIERAL